MSLWMIFDPVWSPEWLWLRYATLLRATLLLAVFATAAGCLRRAPAALRAWLWAAALLALLPLPMLRALPIHWSAHVVPAIPAAPMITIGATMVTQSSAAAAAVPWTSAVGGIWLLGALVVIFRLLLGWRGLSALAGRSEPVADTGWRTLTAESARTLGLRRQVRLLRSTEVPVPLTWGTRRPSVLLPGDADTWPEKHRRAVMLHELAHVRRLDSTLAVLAHLACALWWFHPGAWWAASRLRLERERACDERVLRAGVRPSDYAECLLHVADAGQRFRGPVGVVVAAGFVRRSELRTRLHSILNPAAAQRRTVGPLATAAAVTALLITVLLVGSMRLAPRPDVLWTALRSEHWPTCAWAAENIARFGDAASVAALDAALRDEPHPSVHRMAGFGQELRVHARPVVRRFGWPAPGPVPMPVTVPAHVS